MTSKQPRIRFVVVWHYGSNGAQLEKPFMREAAAKDFIRRMRTFRHHSYGKPRGLRIEVRRIGADA